MPTAVAQFLRSHENVKFDLQTVHHDDLLRKLYERETDIAIAYRSAARRADRQPLAGRGRAGRALPRGGHARRAAVGRARACCAAGASSASPRAARSAQLFTQELRPARARARRGRLGAHLLHRRARWCGRGSGMTVVDSFTAQASLAPGLSMRPLKPQLDLRHPRDVPDQPAAERAGDRFPEDAASG